MVFNCIWQMKLFNYSSNTFFCYSTVPCLSVYLCKSCIESLNYWIISFSDFCIALYKRETHLMCFTLSYLQHNWWRSKQGSSSLEGCRWWVRGIGFEAQTLRSVRSCLLYRKRQNKFGCRPESGLHPSPPLCPPPQRLRLGSYIFDPHEWWSHTEKKKHRSFNRGFPAAEKRKEKNVKSDTLFAS